VNELTLPTAQKIISAALDYARGQGLQPLCIMVLDARGALKAAASEDGTSLRRAEVAHGKAHGALALATGSRALAKRAEDQPHFIAAVSHVVGGALVPVPGGVLIRSTEGAVIGVIGVSGDSSDNDEAAAVAGIRAAGLVPDPG
jgi:uncharacterized protein GlcG (DUF336 family)